MISRGCLAILVWSRWGKWGARLFLPPIALFFLSSCYLTRQALHHNHLINGRRHISFVLKDPDTSEELRQQLLYLQDILKYAKDQGLDARGTYRYYVETNQDAVSYLVSAAYPDRLESRTWWFPVTGAVPYLGFFEKEQRNARELALRTKGWDTWTMESAAFSGLGWIEDPVFSSMLKRGRSSLAPTIFHELSHRSLWVSGHTEFNEQMASYLEHRLTSQYLRERGLTREAQIYERKKKDRLLYNRWLSDLKKALTSLYKTPPPGGRGALATAKEAVFREFTGPRKPAFSVTDYVGHGSWNNARVLASSLYSPDTERFARAHRCSGLLSAGSFLTRLEKGIRQYNEPFRALDALCSGT